MSQIFWNLVYSLSGVKVRECPSLFFISAKFGPGGPKNGHFWPFFGHFCSFSDLNIFLVNGIFWFLIWCFWACLEMICKKIEKKGQNSSLQGQKKQQFSPLFWPFSQFLDLKIIPVNEFFWLFFYMMFLGIFRSDLHNFWKRVKFWRAEKTTWFFKYHKISMKFGPLFCYKM